MQTVITTATTEHNTLLDITSEIEAAVRRGGVQSGICSVYVRGATAAVMIQENWDDSVQHDVIQLLDRLIPQGVWRHDAQDNNGAAHLKSGVVGPGETVPIREGKLDLSTWQNIFLCEFDGPRSKREVVVTILGDG
jgi:secondary thiamine-phosphate synthase enzyme